MTISLIIATYNSPLQLELCLKSVGQQTIFPNEIIIADDGSGNETHQLIYKYQKVLPIPIIHMWHPDEGFRLSVIRNKAIAVANMDYIIQIDGDVVLNSHFIQDHKRFARIGTFVSGSRLNLSPKLTAKLLSSRSIKVSIFNKGIKNRFNGVRIHFLSRLFENYHRNNIWYVRGCNMAFWRTDLIRVNGYNETMLGWGREDSEIAYRLVYANVYKRFMKNGGIVYHLYHQENSRGQCNINDAILQKTISEKRIRSDKGIDQYL